MNFADFLTSRIERKCEGCKHDGDAVGGDWDEVVSGCDTDECHLNDYDDFVCDCFFDWLDNVNSGIKMDDYAKMAAVMDAKYADNDEYDFFYLRDKAQFSDDCEAFYAWLDANKCILTAEDYKTMGGAV